MSGDPAPDSGAARARSSPVLALIRLVLVIGATIPFYILYLMRHALARGRRNRFEVAARWTSSWSRTLLGILRVRVETSGVGPKSGSMLTPNHVSYLDILAISSVAPCLFVPKGELASWPIIGHLIRISEHPFVPRTHRRTLAGTNAAIRERLALGQNVCVFLEGTSSGGSGVLPFRSPLLQPAIDEAAAIVPVGVRWSAPGTEIQIAEDVAYWKDHAFGPHAWRLFGLSGLVVQIKFDPPLDSTSADRQSLAEIAGRRVAALIDPVDR